MNLASTKVDWITGRDPKDSELQRVQGLGEALLGRFLVWDGEYVALDTFVRPSKTKKDGGGYFSGHWRVGRVKAWMPAPEPPKD